MVPNLMRKVGNLVHFGMRTQINNNRYGFRKKMHLIKRIEEINNMMVKKNYLYKVAQKLLDNC